MSSNVHGKQPPARSTSVLGEGPSESFGGQLSDGNPARDTLRPGGAFAAPPPAEVRAPRRTTLRPAGAGAVPPPSRDLGQARNAPSVRGYATPATRVARPEQGGERRSATDPYFERVQGSAAEPRLVLASELFVSNVPSFDPRLSDELFRRRASRAELTPRRATREAQSPSARASDDLPKLGAIIDKFRLEELLGVGGFAAVYRSTHLLLHTHVAIKLLRPHLLRSQPGLAGALCAEARFAARIDHPNVVRILDVTHTPQITFVVMEYIEGQALSRLIAESPLSLRRTLEIGLQISAGLEAGLREGLVHRDVKPANIMLTKQGSAKIVDFGFAVPIQERRAGLRAGQRATLVGTQGFIAPESAPGRVPDFRADIYALGVTLYQALLGQLPFWAEDAAHCLQLQREQRAPEPERVRPDVPRAVSELLSWMLEREPADRPPSYAAVREALQRALAALQDPAQPFDLEHLEGTQ